MYKILTCDCKMSELEEKRIHISYTGNNFDCLCETEHEVVSTICPLHKLNLVSFPRTILNPRTVRAYALTKTKFVSTANI